MVGNHDIYFKNTNDVNSLQELIGQTSNKFHLYADATEVNIGGLDILFMPWINQQNYIYSMGMIDETKAKVCMGHLEIKGFQMHKGQINDHGYDKELFKKCRTLADSLKLPDCSMGMSGDWEEAIDAGSTWLRLGSIIFGDRS